MSVLGFRESSTVANNHMKITVFRTKRILGLKRFSDLRNEDILAQVVGEPTDLSDALTREWSSDAHLCMYVAEDEDSTPFRPHQQRCVPSAIRTRGGSRVGARPYL